MRSDKFGLIGAGRVGAAIIQALLDKGYSIFGVADKDPAAIERVGRWLNREFARLTPQEVAAGSDILFITTPDDAIAQVYEEIRGSLKPGAVLIHCSGALTSRVFLSGARLSIHPLQIFPSYGERLRPGIYWGVEGDEAVVELGMELVRELGGQPFRLSSDQKPLYHAMAVAGSNFLVVVLELATQLGITAGLHNPLELIRPLIDGAIELTTKLGPIQALSGPFERGEVGVVSSHLSRICESRPELLDLYSALGRRAAELALKKGHLDSKGYQQLSSVLDKLGATGNITNVKGVGMEKIEAEFLAQMSHELRTPLNSVIGFTELMLDELAGPLTDVQRRYLKFVHGSGLELLKLINSLIDLSRLRAGTFETYEERVDVEKAIEGVVAEYRDQIEAKGLKLKVVVGPELERFITDLHRFQQILSTLMSNAVKFTDKGTIEVQAELKGDRVAVTVADTGIGIPKEELPYIFEEFRLPGEFRRGLGSRLSLALAQRIAAELGGSIEVESEPGKGSRFTCLLPYRYPKEVELPPQIEPPARDLGRTVLVIEDNPLAADLLTTWLKEAGYSAVVARNGEEGLRLAQELRPIAITLDVILPEIDGWQVLHRLKEMSATREIPVIICSIVDNREFGLSLGAVEYLTKPISRKELLENLSRTTRLKPKGRKILVVDDNPADVSLVEEILRLDNYEVIKAYSGVEGLKKAREEHPDLLILDLLMPDLSGFDVAHLLRASEATRELPIIIFTVKELSQPEREQLKLETQAIVEKAKLDREEMRRLIKETLTRLAHLK